MSHHYNRHHHYDSPLFTTFTTPSVTATWRASTPLPACASRHSRPRSHPPNLSPVITALPLIHSHSPPTAPSERPALSTHTHLDLPTRRSPCPHPYTLTTLTPDPPPRHGQHQHGRHTSAQAWRGQLGSEFTTTPTCQPLLTRRPRSWQSSLTEVSSLAQTRELPLDPTLQVEAYSHSAPSSCPGEQSHRQAHTHPRSGVLLSIRLGGRHASGRGRCPPALSSVHCRLWSRAPRRHGRGVVREAVL